MKETLMYKEIYESVDKVKDCLEYNQATLKQLADKIKEFNPSNIIIDARGTSLHAGMYAKYLFEIYFGIPVSIASQAVFTIYNKNLKVNKSLVIAISQSGNGKDVTKVLEDCRKNGALTLAITNTLGSPTAEAGEYHLYCNVGEAEAYAATKTFTSTMYLLTKLGYELSGNSDLLINEKDLVSSLRNSLSMENEIYNVADNFKNTEDIIVLGRGLNYSLAMEFALKLRETINIHTSSYQISEFYHGPIMMTSPKRNIFMIATEKEAYDDVKDMLKKVKKMGAITLLITNNVDLIQYSDYSLVINNNNKILALFNATIIMQLFVACFSNIRGKNPDYMEELATIDTF